MSDVHSPPFQPPTDDESLEYHAVEPLAIVALLVGLFSPLALIAGLLGAIPLFGLAVASGALLRIARDERRGRGLALTGLALSGFFLALPLARYASSQVLLARQGRTAADEFVAFLHAGSPEKAVLLQMSPDFRPPIDDGLWSFFRNDAQANKQLREFVTKPYIRMLLALGDRADIQFYKTNASIAGNGLAYVDYKYTVTFTDEDQQKKTILFSVMMERKPTENSALNPWRVKDFSADLPQGHTPT